MTENQQTQGQPASDNNDGQQQAQQNQPYFVAQTKEDYERVYGPTRQEGRSSYEKWLLEQTGAEKPDDVIAAYTQAQEVARELEGEQVQQVRTEYEEKLTAERDAGKALRKEYALRDALRDAGINGERLPLALRVADLSTLSVGQDNAVSGLEDAVNGIKEASPEWFGEPKPATVGRGSAPGGSASTRLDFTNMSQAEFEQVQAQVRAGNVIRP